MPLRLAPVGAQALEVGRGCNRERTPSCMGTFQALETHNETFFLFFFKGETVRPTRVSGPDDPGEAGEDARKSAGGVGVPQLGCAKCCTNCFLYQHLLQS